MATFYLGKRDSALVVKRDGSVTLYLAQGDAFTPVSALTVAQLAALVQHLPPVDVHNTDTTPHHRLTCGCCTGDGQGYRPENDQCVCDLHCDIPGGVLPHTCAHHRT